MFPEEDTLLSQTFLKVIDATTKDLLMTEEKTSGVKMFQAIKMLATMEKLEDESLKDFITFSQIECKGNETIKDYTVRVQKAACELAGTEHEQNHVKVVHQWRKGLGKDFLQFNLHCTLTGTVPRGWDEDLPLLCLALKAQSHLKEANIPETRTSHQQEDRNWNHKGHNQRPPSTLSIPQAPETPEPSTSHTSQGGTNAGQNQRSTHWTTPLTAPTEQLLQLELWQRDLRQFLGSYGAITDPAKEKRDYIDKLPL
eukprot:9184850-Ditylum_brightwellii.AAC.1